MNRDITRERVILIYGRHQKRRAESLRVFFEGLGLKVEMIEAVDTSGVDVKYNGIRWGDPEEAIRYIVDQFIKRGVI